EPPVELSPARRTLGCSFLLGPAVKRTTRCDQARSSAARRRKSVPGEARSRVPHRDAGTCRRRAGDRFGSSAHAVLGTAVARVTFWTLRSSHLPRVPTGEGFSGRRNAHGADQAPCGNREGEDAGAP